MVYKYLKRCLIILIKLYKIIIILFFLDEYKLKSQVMLSVVKDLG